MSNLTTWTPTNFSSYYGRSLGCPKPDMLRRSRGMPRCTTVPGGQVSSEPVCPGKRKRMLAIAGDRMEQGRRGAPGGAEGGPGGQEGGLGQEDEHAGHSGRQDEAGEERCAWGAEGGPGGQEGGLGQEDAHAGHSGRQNGAGEERFWFQHP
eukprot:gene31599-6795_t